MSELTLTLIKLGFLAVLWLFVLSAVSVIRSDVFGTKAPAAAPRPKAKPKDKGRSKPEPKSRKPTRGVPTKLQVVSGPNAGQSVPLSDQPILLGRGTDASIRLDDDYVSTRHARFATNGEQWFVEDVGSHQRHLPRQPARSPARCRSASASRSGSARPSSSCGSDR